MAKPLPSAALQRTRVAAWAWTLLILGACFLPGSEIPNVRLPLADKWVHFILFGVLCALWLLAAPLLTLRRAVFITVACILFGYAVEVLQGALRPWLGRSYDGMDALSDGIGAVLGAAAVLAVRRRN